MINSEALKEIRIDWVKFRQELKKKLGGIINPASINLRENTGEL